MTDYEKLKQIIDEIPNLISANITALNPDFQAWHTKTERFLIHKYGEDSYEHCKFTKTLFTLRKCSSSTPRSSFVLFCQVGLKTTQKILQDYLKEMTENSTTISSSEINHDYSQVFIVHGHDGELKQSVARIVEKQGITPIILSEQANQGKTIIEKFENYSHVGGAICLFTSDDVGRGKKESFDKSRARQNVVFETGYFIGKLGRDHIVILSDTDIEIPSDLSGVLYTSTTNWKTDLLNELKAIGYTIDFNKMF